MVERELELGRIGAFVDTIVDRSAGILVLEGPAGIGKTSLLAAAREAAAAAAGIRVLSARASELERGYAFGIARQWFQPTLAAASVRERRRLFEGAAGIAESVVSPHAAPAEQASSPAVLHGLYWLIANASSAELLLLALDDAQWADEGSLRLLNYLVPRHEGLAIGALVACRPPDLDEEGELLSRLLANDEVEIIRPRPLSVSGTARLLSDRIGQEPEQPFVEACQAATGGNPFYLRELGASLAEEGIPPIASQIDRIGAVRPRSLARVLLMRISGSARALAQALALLERPADLELAGALAGLDRLTAAEAADELIRAGLMADRQPAELAHAIVRAAVLSSLSAHERAIRHDHAAALLRERRAGPEQVAAHLLATEPSSDGEVAATLQEAAREAMRRGAAEPAVRLLRRALSEPPAPGARGRVLLDLGNAEHEASLPEAVDRFREAHRVAEDPLLRGEALRRLAGASHDLAHQQAIADVLEREIAEVAPLDRELALALEAARLIGLMVSPNRSSEALARLERVAELQGATPGECVLLARLAQYRMDTGRPADEVADIAERAIADPRTLEAEGPDSLWLLSCAFTLAQCERFDLLDTVLEQALSLARDRGSAAGFALVSGHRARLAHRRGALRDAEAEARAALDSEALYPRYRPVVASELVAVLSEQGRLEAAQAAYDAIGLGERIPDERGLTPLLIGRGILRGALGQHERAVLDLRESLRRIARYAPGTTAGMDARLLLATTLHRLGRGHEALAEADRALALARAWGTPGMMGEALRAHALVIGGDRAIHQLHEAIVDLAASPLRLGHARALIDLGGALRRAGRRADCREPLRTGLEFAEGAGAEPLARLAREELNASGVRVSRQRVGDELTPSERRIVDMAAAGMSNPQIAQALFVTVKTVESHLGRAYLKLGVKSRHELTTALGTARAAPRP